MLSLSGIVSRLMEGIVCERALSLQKKAHLREHVGADAGDHIGADIELSSGGERRSGRR